MADSEISQQENPKLSERRMLKKLAISKLTDQDESQDLVEKYIALSPQRAQIKKQLTIMHQKQRVDDDRLVDWVQYKQEIGSPPNPFQINDFICEMELKKDPPIAKKAETKTPKNSKLPELPQRPKTQSPKRGNQTIPNIPEPGVENYYIGNKPTNEKELQSFKDRQNFKRISFQSYKKGGSNLKKISNSLNMNQNNSVTSVENTNPSPPMSPEKGKLQSSVEVSNMASLRTAFVNNHRNFVIKEVEKEFSKNNSSNYRLPVSSLRLSKLGHSENLDRLNRSENSRIRLKSAMKQSIILLDEDKKAFSPSKLPKQSLFKDESLIHIEIQRDGSPQNNASIDSPNPFNLQNKSDVKIPLRQILSSIRPGPGGNSPIPYNTKNSQFPSRPIKFLKSNTYGYSEQSPIIRNDKTSESGIFTSKLELPSPVTPNKFNFILTGLESNKKTGRSNKSSDNRFKIARKELSRSLNYDMQERIKNVNILSKIQEKQPQPQANESFEFLSGLDQPPRRSKIGTLNLDRIGTPAKSIKNESSVAHLPDKIRCIDILDQASGMLQDLQKEEKEINMMADECDKSHQKVEDLYMNLKKVDYVNSGVLQIMYNYQKKAVAEQRKEQSSVIAEYHDLKEKNIAVRHKTETQVIKSLFKRLKQKRKNILQSIS